MEHLRNFLSGVSCLFSPVSARDYPKYRGFGHDAAQMNGDWARVGGDMRVALKRERLTRPKNGKQSNKSKR